MSSYAVAIDVGGTFTDVVLSDLDTGEYRILKTPSTPSDPSRGFLAGFSRILEAGGVDPRDVRGIFHGTTIATNAILENKGARVGVIVSDGFKYVLEIGRHAMERLASPYVWVKPARPVAPEHVLEAPERTSFLGEIIEPLEDEAVRSAARQFREAGIDSIAVSLVHSYANPAHERRARDLILEEFPQARVSLSSEVLPVFREYERAMTTALNAYVMPQVSDYIGNLERSLLDQGIEARLLIMKSNGGMIGADTATRQPVYTALSGPAAGVMAARHIGEAAGLANTISFDMGGTSTDVSLIDGSRVSTTSEGQLGQWPMQLPMVDIVTIGAGGGSIAWLSPSGGLAVGPRSAGADPGPVCYGQGGAEPTVTDANLALGRIDSSLAGGALTLDAAAAREAIEARIAAPLGLDLYRAASGIVQIVNNNMMGAIRNVSVERGHDPRQFALVAFGGAGPMHAVSVAKLLDMTLVVAPRHPGISSAYGLLVSDFKNDYARTFLQKPPDYDLEGMERVFTELEQEATDWLENEKVAGDRRRLTRLADLRYAHQGFEVTVTFSGDRVSAGTMHTLIETFHQQHRQLFGFSLDQPVEVVTLRVTALGELGAPGMPELSGDLVAPDLAVTGQRQVFFDEIGGFAACDIFRRGRLVTGSIIAGPAILEDLDSTVVINPGWQGQVDRHGNCLIRPQ